MTLRAKTVMLGVMAAGFAWAACAAWLAGLAWYLCLVLGGIALHSAVDSFRSARRDSWQMLHPDMRECPGCLRLFPASDKECPLCKIITPRAFLCVKATLLSMALAGLAVVIGTIWYLSYIR